MCSNKGNTVFSGALNERIYVSLCVWICKLLIPFIGAETTYWIYTNSDKINSKVFAIRCKGISHIKRCYKNNAEKSTLV